MKQIILFGVIFFTIGIVFGIGQLSYRVGVRDGVIHTEKCMDNWGKMKHDGWDFYCLH